MRPDLRTLLRGKRNCVLVAHPDDETLWAGGLMLAHPGDWTVICCSIPRRDPIRAWKFYRACERLGARGKVLPVIEPDANGALLSPMAIGEEIERFDVLVTHGGNGEYGHAHHRQINVLVANRIRATTLCFNPGGIAGGQGHAPPEYRVRRNMKSWLRALRCYDHVLEYEPLGKVRKWEALLHRYGTWEEEGFDLMPTWHWHALADMAKEHGWRQGVELGVRMGQNLFSLLYHAPELRMIGIDLFEPQPGNLGEGQETYEDWPWADYLDVVSNGKTEFGERVDIWKSDTVEAAERVEDGSLDFVFIDADHSYPGVKRDIEAWRPKVRRGGFVTGHDIHMSGVKRAVEESFRHHETRGWELNYLWWVQC